MSRESEKMRAHEEHRKMWRKARASEKKLTPKQKVLKRFPDAKAVRNGSTWQVTIDGWTRFGTTAADAWWRASVSTPMRRFRRIDSTTKGV